MEWVRRRRIAAHALIAVSVGLLIVAVLSWDRLVSLAARIPLVPFAFVIMSVGCAVAADQLYRRTRPERQRRSAPRIRWWWVVLAFAAVLVAVWATTALLMPQTLEMPPGGARLKQEIEVVRTGLAAGAGVGAAITVLLAFRRQQHHEEATEKTDYDASERRITELYTTAVEQLGSSQAPVRLGGLYALERLGQAVDSHRQTIVDVICAYLRMPYTPPVAPRPSEERQRRGSRQAVSRSRQADRALIRGGREADQERRQELQVRETAQRILTSHLSDHREPDERQTTPADDQFWEGMRIDLSHATLTSCDFSNFHVDEADFTQATFTGPVSFDEATFTDSVSFSNVAFTDIADFSIATFTGYVWFKGATFTGEVWFNHTTFTGPVWFDEATFTDIADFNRTVFKSSVQFDEARARLMTREGLRTHTWPMGWDIRPTGDGWGILKRT